MPEPKPESNDADVTTQPAISTEEAAQTDVVLSPVGDEKVEIDTDVVEERSELQTAIEPDLQIRDKAERIVRMRIVPWDTVISTNLGKEKFERGAFDDTDASLVRLRMDHQDPPTGKGIAIEQPRDAAYAEFRVARTSRGDDQLALIDEGVSTGASVGFEEVAGGSVVETINGQRVRVHRRVRLREVSTTWRPAYEQAGVMYVRSEPHTEIAPMTETTEVPVSGANNDAILAAFAQIEARAAAQQAVQEKFMDRMEKFEEQHRAQIEFPSSSTKPKVEFTKGEWLQTVVRLISGERLPDLQMRALEDVITTDNPGVVPPTYLTELIGVIDASRPFLSSTRRLEEPATMKLTVPVITQRPLAAVQATEKTEVESRKTIITSTDFDAITIAGAGDLSIQLIKKSTPSFLNLWMELLAEAYAIEAEDQAIQALFNAIGGVGSGTALNPEDMNLGAAYVAAFDAIRRPPDTIWLSTQAVGEFIDAKATTTNQPLYPGLAASATAAGGITGVISGLRPVHVPTLDAHGAYAIVGPSSGFAWAEGGTYTLQADNPTLAGRDIALVGLLYPAPWYPAAFTAYNVAS